MKVVEQEGNYMLRLHNKTIFKEFRKELRKNATNTEQHLWNALKGKKLNGYRFRRQHSFDKYVFDFYCPAVRLAVEIDGPIHDERSAHIWDQNRTAYLNAHSIDVLRFSNEDVLNRLTDILQIILKTIEAKNNPPTPSCG